MGFRNRRFGGSLISPKRRRSLTDRIDDSDQVYKLMKSSLAIVFGFTLCAVAACRSEDQIHIGVGTYSNTPVASVVDSLVTLSMGGNYSALYDLLHGAAKRRRVLTLDNMYNLSTRHKT
jgi:hypothetical protein